MNWEAIGAIGEVAGAVGVILTMTYLAVQIRQNTKSMRASAHQSVMEGSATMNALIAGDESVARIWRVGGSDDRSELSPDDRLRHQFMISQWFLAFEAVYIQHDLGSLSDEFFEGKMENVTMIINQPGIRRIWERSTQQYAESFVRYVNENLIA